MGLCKFKAVYSILSHRRLTS